MAYLKTDLSDNLTEKMKNLSDAELLANLTHPAAMVRAFVLREAAQTRIFRNGVLRERVREELLADSNRQTNLQGIITVTLFVLGEMLSDPVSHGDAISIIRKLSLAERRALMQYMREPLPELQAA